MATKRKPVWVNVAGRRRAGRPSHDGAETRQAVIDAAEKLFSATGVEGVSMRAISAAAGFARGAADYHFGSKDRLLKAVILRRGVAIARRVDEQLDALAAGGQTMTPRDLVEAIAAPYRELLDADPSGGGRWLRIVGHLLRADDPVLRQLTADSGGSYERFWRFLQLAFPGVPASLLAAGSRLAMNTLYQMLGNSDTPRMTSAGRDRVRISQGDIDTLVKFVAYGLAGLMNGEA